MKLKLETEKQKFFHLLAEVVEDLPSDVSLQMWNAGHQIRPLRLNNIRYGRTIDLEALVLIIKTCLPAFNSFAAFNIHESAKAVA